MTAARQWKKAFTAGLGALSLLVLAWLAGGFAAGMAAAQREPVVVNPQTGLAISGFDPVAYFTDKAAMLGRADMELDRDGVVWRFRNEGNRAAFAAHPAVYGPQFGGYDPVAIARGASVAGHPEFWLVSGKRLYLFYSAQARATFAAEPDRLIQAAEHKWPGVRRTLP
jgi:hypothetical protein